MDIICEGSFTTRPLVLDRSNYAYWKAIMIVFLKSIDSKIWKAMVTWLEHITVIDAYGKVLAKPEPSWGSVEDEVSLRNSRALNAIFNDIDQNVFKLINTCTSVKEAWGILEVV